MKANPGKKHVLLSSNTQLVAPFDILEITSSLSQKLLGIIFDAELKFEEHISKICNKVNKKLNALHLNVNHMDLDKLKILLKASAESQFNYCSLIWMFLSRNLNNKIKIKRKSIQNSAFRFQG